MKTESKSENPAAENRGEADKSVPIVKKDVENVPPQKAPVSSFYTSWVAFIFEGNETSLMRVWKLLSSRRVLKP